MHALGLHRIGQSVIVSDAPELRGMTRAIRFLLRTEPHPLDDINRVLAAVHHHEISKRAVLVPA
jgi:hypothetical protein